METHDATSNAGSGGKLPKKYIRTFAGDMEIVKQGGSLDLAPFVPKNSESSSEPDGSSASKGPVPPPPIPSPMQQPIPEPEFVPEPAPEPIPEPEPIPVPPSAPVPPPAPKPIPPPTKPAPQPVEIFPPSSPPPPARKAPAENPIETYSSDFSNRLKETHASTASILAAEQDAGPLPTEPNAPQRAPMNIANILYIAAGVLFLVLGGIGAYVAYTHFTAENAPVAPIGVAAAPIFVDERVSVSGEGTALSRAIEDSVQSPLAAGAVRLLYLATTTGTGTDNVFAALQPSAPDELVRNINADGSMAGIVNAGGIQSPFFILSVSSYSVTFGGMLAWEPMMATDLAALFPPFAPAANTAPAPVATTTSKTTKNATTTIAIAAKRGGFDDESVNNHDVRVYRDEAGRIVLLYGYWNQTTLVIARDPAAFSEIIGRLANSHT
ncbi:MAG: hypothetical protein WAN50_04190 [Minisyncoccia bacterium]